MANRPVFIPNLQGSTYVREDEIEFDWVPGMSLSQKKKNVISLHKAASRIGLQPILEISTKSQIQLGIALSAFNLMIKLPNLRAMSVECAFQGSKVFQKGGPFQEFYSMNSRDIRKDERLRGSGSLLRFDLNGEIWDLDPKTAFYDWLYMTALLQNKELSLQLLSFNGFTDIEFNPEKAINCQAKTAALFVALYKQGLLEPIMRSKEEYLATMKSRVFNHNNIPKINQLCLFDK